MSRRRRLSPRSDPPMAHERANQARRCAVSSWPARERRLAAQIGTSRAPLATEERNQAGQLQVCPLDVVVIGVGRERRRRQGETTTTTTGELSKKSSYLAPADMCCSARREFVSLREALEVANEISRQPEVNLEQQRWRSSNNGARASRTPQHTLGLFLI